MICTLASESDINGVSFNCGQEVINAYFKDKLLTDDDAVSYCFWSDDKKQDLVGIASLSCSGIVIHSGNGFNITPAIEVKIFAVDEKFQHRTFPGNESEEDHWSDYCLWYLIEKIYEISEKQCGASHVVLYSVPEAVTFYQRNGFQNFVGEMEMPSNFFTEGCIPMFLNL